MTPWLALLGGLVCASQGGRGHVIYTTAERAFLDSGSLDGLRLGDTLSLVALDRSASSCRVDSIGDHHASCLGKRAPSHGTFSLPRPPAAAPVAPPPPTLLSTVELQQTRKEIAQTPVSKIAFHATEDALGPLRHRLWVELGHTSYLLTSASQPFNRQGEHLELSLRGIPLGAADLSASLRLTALLWTAQTPMLRFREGARGQLYIWQGELARREVHDTLVFGAGRLLPWYAPGLPVLDGGQLGWRAPGGTGEVGGFAGGLPDTVSLLPTFGRWTVGAYGMALIDFSQNLHGMQTGRLAFVSLPNNDSRIELEAQSTLSYGRALFLTVNPRLGFNLAHTNLALDALRADAVLRFSDAWLITLGGRYSSAFLTIEDGFVSPTALQSDNSIVAAAVPHSTTVANGSVRFIPTTWLSLAATGVFDTSSADTTHLLAGPEVGLPHLFGSIGGVTVAYLAEGGSAAGQSFYIQSLLAPSPHIGLWLRASLFHDVFEGNEAINELAFYGRCEGRITEWLSATGSLLVRPQLPNATFNAATLTAITARLGLAARL